MKKIIKFFKLLIDKQQQDSYFNHGYAMAVIDMQISNEHSNVLDIARKIVNCQREEYHAELSLEFAKERLRELQIKRADMVTASA